jgi:outer membrane protein
MKMILRNVLPGLLLVTLLSGPAFAQTRIGTVDLRKVFDGYWKTKQADAALKDRAADMDKSHKEMLDGWRKAKEDYAKLLSDANDQAVSAEERERRKRAAETKLRDMKETEENIGQFERQARTTLDEQKRRMRDNILGEIRTVLNARAKQAGFTLVIDTAAETINSTPVILYTAGDNDLTDQVLSQLNAAAPIESTSKPAEKKK